MDGKKGQPRVMELRGLEPPEPMVRILRALEEMAVGETLAAVLPHRPVFFLPLLEERNQPYQLEETGPGRWVLSITKK